MLHRTERFMLAVKKETGLVNFHELERVEKGKKKEAGRDKGKHFLLLLQRQIWGPPMFCGICISFTFSIIPEYIILFGSRALLIND